MAAARCGKPGEAVAVRATVVAGAERVARMRAVALRVLALLVPAAVLLAGCGDDFGGCTGDCLSVNNGGPVVKGSGTAKTENRTVAPFTAIRLEFGGRAEIERTGAASLAVTADDNLLGLLTGRSRTARSSSAWRRARASPARSRSTGSPSPICTR